MTEMFIVCMGNNDLHGGIYFTFFVPSDITEGFAIVVIGGDPPPQFMWHRRSDQAPQIRTQQPGTSVTNPS
jgi:hypothetical protein